MSALLNRLKSSGPKRILALDGGGIRGAITLGYLESIEKILQERYQNPNLRLCDYFDLIGGTSTGAIIASGLAIGMSAKEIKEKYLAIGANIFGKKYRWYIPWELPGYLRAGFDATPLRSALKEIFGDIKIGDDAIKTGLCIVAKRADTFSTWPVINHPEGKYYNQNKNILLRHMIRASTAAPTYFIPQLVNVGGEEAAFVDGGVSMANNPSLLLFMIATLKGFPFHWDIGADKLSITSIGTGTSKKKLSVMKVAKRNILGWAGSVPDLLMEDATYLNQMMLQYLSKSPTAVAIDSEIGNMAEDKLYGKEALHYVRYNTWLDNDWLKDLGMHFSEKELASLREMSNAQNRFILAEIGEKSAKHLINPSHFPAIFDIK